MPEIQTLVLGFATAGAVGAVLAATGRLSGRLARQSVDRLYYVSYGCSAVAAALFIAQGLFGPRP